MTREYREHQGSEIPEKPREEMDSQRIKLSVENVAEVR